VKFVAIYGVMSGRYRSTLGSNFHLCVSRFKFNGCVNADNVIRQHCFSLRDELRFGVAQFMRDSITLRDSVDKYGFFSVLSRNEITCIVDYLATM